MPSIKLPLVLALLLPALNACAEPYDAPAADAAPAVTVTIAAPSATAPTASTAESTPAATPEIEALRVKLEKTLSIPVQAVRPSPLPGIYEIQSGLNFGYVSADGEYLIEGDLVRLSTGETLTENNRRLARVAAVEKLGVDNMIVFAPPAKDIKHTVTVFTDVDCGYCRMLHSQVADYNAKGIAIRYVFFPRTGPNTESFRKAEVVWCAADRKAALTVAKTGVAVNGDASCKNPVLDQYNTGTSIGVRGTPALILEDGELIPGYQPPEQLAQLLDAKSAKPAAATAAPAPTAAKPETATKG
jgi:thiol:disulfide interchange protein DsbC